MSPPDAQEIIDSDNDAPCQVQAVQLLLRTEPDTPVIIFQQTVDRIGYKTIACRIDVRFLFAGIEANKPVTIRRHPDVSGRRLHEATDGIVQQKFPELLVPTGVPRRFVKNGQSAATGNQQ